MLANFALWDIYVNLMILKCVSFCVGEGGAGDGEGAG